MSDVTSLNVEFLFHLHATLDAPAVVPGGPHGTRVIVGINGGTVTGPKVNGTLAHLAGAKYEIEFKDLLGMSNMWVWSNDTKPRQFPATPWALDLNMADFPYPKMGRGPMKDQGKGEWFWESGFNKDPIKDLELMRDWNFRAVYGAFNAMKNKEGAAQHQNAKLVLDLADDIHRAVDQHP